MRARTALPWLLVLVAVLALGGGLRSSGPGRSDAVPGASFTARVVRVVDGDTIKVRAGSRLDTVRYIGMDTPESVKPGTPVQCYAHAASSENARLVGGQEVRLRVGAEPRDRYGRLLAYVYRVRDGRLVNAALLAGGYAHTLTIPPNDALAPAFSRIEESARARGRGLWRACPVLAAGYR